MNGMLMGYTISNQTWQLEIPQSGWFFLAGKIIYCNIKNVTFYVA